jgi:hypothetical protein
MVGSPVIHRPKLLGYGVRHPRAARGGNRGEIRFVVGDNGSTASTAANTRDNYQVSPLK